MEGDDGADERGEVDHEQAVVCLHCERLDLILIWRREKEGGGRRGREERKEERRGGEQKRKEERKGIDE